MRKKIFLAGIFALSASASLAQTTTPPQPAGPAVETQGGQAAAPQQDGPANLCQELLAFMKAPPEAPAPAAAAKPATAPAQQGASAQQTGSAQQQPAPSQQSASNQQGSSALAGTTAAGEGASAKPEGGSGSAQAVTGQKGVATDAPDPGKDKAASGSVANAPQKDTRAAPTPPADVTSTPKESVLSVEAAEQLAGANDLAQCQKTAREMRVAGVAMPPPLIALAALDLQYQQQSGVPAQPSGEAGGSGTAPQPPAPQ